MKKIMLPGMLIIVLLATGFLSIPQASTMDRPPGVSAEKWVPLSGNAGIMLIKEEKFYRASPLALHGILFVRVAGIWQKITLDAQGGVQLLGLP